MKRIGVALALLLALAWVYAGALGHDFLSYDDDLYVTGNPSLRAPLDLAAVERAFARSYDANWIPLTTLSWHLDYAWHGLDPAAFHATNLALHALSTLLLLLALHALTGALAPSAFAAGVFALHPLHVESVAWVVERKSVLAGVFFHAALLAYARSARSARPRHLGASASFAAGLLSKQSVVPLPGVLLLLDFWPLRRFADERGVRWAIASLREKGLPIALAVAGSLAVLWAQKAGGAMEHGDALPFGVRLANAALAIGAYLREAVWPAGLAAFHPHPERAVPVATALAVGAALAAVTALCWRLRGRAPWLGVGWLWFLALLLPTLGLVQVGVQSRADRYTYLALTGPALALAWSAHVWAAAHALRRRACALLAIALLAACAVVARRQVAVWHDTETLFRHAIAVTEGNYLAEHAIGSELLRRGEAAEAEAHFAEALRMRPQWPEASFGLADALFAEGRLEEAIRRYEHGLRAAPRSTRGQIRLARALLATGRSAEALGRARHALATARPHERAEAAALLGAVLIAHEALPEAEAAYGQAIALRPDLAEAHAGLGMALLAQGRSEAGYAALQRALALGGPEAPLELALGDAARLLGRPDEAYAHYREARRAGALARDADLVREAEARLAETRR